MTCHNELLFILSMTYHDPFRKWSVAYVQNAYRFSR